MTQDETKPTLIKFKVFWDDRISEHDGFDEEIDHHYQENSAIIYASSEEEAYEIWEQQYANEHTNEIDRIEPVIEQLLLDQDLEIEMPDGATYLVPVKFIAEHRARTYADQFDGDEFKSLLEDTLPFFKHHPSKIAVWATQEISWDQVRKASRKITPEPNPDDMETSWKAGAGAKIRRVKFDARTLKYLSAASIIELICNELGTSDQWKINAAELVKATIPLQVKMRDIDWYPVTPGSITTNASLFNLTDAVMETADTYSIHESEFAQLILPIKNYFTSVLGIKDSERFTVQDDTIEENHNQILFEIKQAIQNLIKNNE